MTAVLSEMSHLQLPMGIYWWEALQVLLHPKPQTPNQHVPYHLDTGRVLHPLIFDIAQCQVTGVQMAEVLEAERMRPKHLP